MTITADEPTLTPAAVVAGAWLTQAQAASDSVAARAGALATAAWAQFDAWYDDAAVATTAAVVAATSADAQGIVSSHASEVVGQIISALTGRRRIVVPRISTPTIRGGADPVVVHSRPAQVYRDTFATTGDEAAARAAAFARELELIETDIMLAVREAERDSYEAVGVTHYRRVIHPELSKSGTCGLCIAAADQIYSTRDLLPIHPPSCRCKTLPILDGKDPAAELNTSDLYKLAKQQAGGKADRYSLSKVRYQVREHGEYGPTLTVAGQHFTGPQQIAKPTGITPAQATKQLAALHPVLASLESRAAAGSDVAKPLAYQRRLIAKLERIAAGG
ncbi:hypothetical protein [Nocardioides sp.]|uniref:hypothetical protein n=1 Tax=Nocardioides sp. TaxID=35761 RepID=UPI002618FC14|nr:hypothetical protein [Nocardioides sp.]